MKALREFIDWESEFMTTASDMTAVVLEDGTKRDGTFLAEEENSSKI